jgi:hypothetical protein
MNEGWDTGLDICTSSKQKYKNYQSLLDFMIGGARHALFFVFPPSSCSSDIPFTLYTFPRPGALSFRKT